MGNCGHDCVQMKDLLRWECSCGFLFFTKNGPGEAKEIYRCPLCGWVGQVFPRVADKKDFSKIKKEDSCLNG